MLSTVRWPRFPPGFLGGNLGTASVCADPRLESNTDANLVHQLVVSPPSAYHTLSLVSFFSFKKASASSFVNGPKQVAYGESASSSDSFPINSSVS